MIDYQYTKYVYFIQQFIQLKLLCEQNLGVLVGGSSLMIKPEMKLAQVVDPLFTFTYLNTHYGSSGRTSVAVPPRCWYE